MKQPDPLWAELEQMTEDLERVKTYVLLHRPTAPKTISSGWHRLMRAAKHVRWDHVGAVEEIRRQRGRG